MDYKNINDNEQLYLISENDDNSYNIMIEKYKPIILSVAKKYYSKMNYHGGDLEDLIQEGYIGLDRAIKTFNENEDVLFFTFSTLCIERQIKGFYKKYNTLKNEYINNSVSIEHQIDDNISLIDTFMDNSRNSNPEKCIIDNNINEYLINFKNSLTTKQSSVFELRYNGFKYKEIANLLDISVSSVDNCLHICRNKYYQYFTQI